MRYLVTGGAGLSAQTRWTSLSGEVTASSCLTISLPVKEENLADIRPTRSPS